MSKNKFEVDLGSIELTTAQRASINSAIQNAVAGELARAAVKGHIVLVPIHDWKGPIINGIIARNLDLKSFENLIAQH